MKRSIQFLSVLFGASLALSACGGGDKSSDDDAKSDDGKTADEGEKKDGDDAKKADEGEKKAEVKGPEFKAYGEGEAPIVVSELKMKADKNFLGAKGSKNFKTDFKVKLVKAVEQGTMVTVKSTCKFGDEFLADTSSPLLQLDKLSEGETKEADTILYGMTGFEGDPEICEVNFYVNKMISTDPPFMLADFCWKGDATTDGKCDGFTRPATDGTPIKISKATAELDEIKFGDNKGRKDLDHRYTITVGNAIESGKNIFVKTACQVGDEKIVDESPVMASFRYAQPGDSFRASSSSYPMKGVASDPSQCDLTFMLKGLFDKDGDDLASYCFKDGALAEGKCG